MRFCPSTEGVGGVAWSNIELAPLNKTPMMITDLNLQTVKKIMFVLSVWSYSSELPSFHLVY